MLKKKENRRLKGFGDFLRLGDEQYGIDIKYVDNIVRMQHITRVPKIQDYLKGVINLRGEVIPVMSIRVKMDPSRPYFTRTATSLPPREES